MLPKHVPVILVMNKADTAAKADIARFMEGYKSLYPFHEMVPVSALRAQNLDTLLDLVFACLPEGVPFYDEETVTDQTQREIAAEIIREKALRCLDDEIPHGIAVSIERMRERSGQDLMDIEAVIVCERESHKGIVIGKGGRMLSRIGSQARRDIEEMLEMQVNLQLWVKVRRDWRDSELMMKSFGYNKKDLQ